MSQKGSFLRQILLVVRTGVRRSTGEGNVHNPVLIITSTYPWIVAIATKTLSGQLGIAVVGRPA
jgi:hypothetical protein